MLEANIKTLLGNVRPEEVTDTKMELLPVNTGAGTYTLSNGAKFSDFEYISCALYASSTATQAGTIFEKEALIVGNSLSVKEANGALTGQRVITVTIDSDTAVTITDDGSIASSLAYFIGFKRRYSKTSLAEITEAASKPNLFINTWHAGAKVRNQRGFDGNWSALAIGEYGLDMWLKTSATHKGFIVEAGSYKPSTKHTILAEDGGILGEAISPADGGHWLHAFPFASDKFSIREGDIPLGWSPDTDSRLDECDKSYIQITSYFSLRNLDVYGNRQDITLSSKLRKPATWQFLSYFGDVAVTASTFQAIGGDPYISSNIQDIFSVRNQTSIPNTGDVWITWKADATIALSEVTDDAEHRVVWG